jgi:hypothetical protein
LLSAEFLGGLNQLTPPQVHDVLGDNLVALS